MPISYDLDGERDRIAALMGDAEAPLTIKKELPVIVGGNVNNLGLVWADKFGRLWSETKDELRMVYNPKVT